MSGACYFAQQNMNESMKAKHSKINFLFVANKF